MVSESMCRKRAPALCRKSTGLTSRLIDVELAVGHTHSHNIILILLATEERVKSCLGIHPPNRVKLSHPLCNSGNCFTQEAT